MKGPAPSHAASLASQAAPTWLDNPQEEALCLEATRGLCNSCGGLCDAQVRVEGSRVVILKWCPEHGPSRGLVSSDVAWHLRSLAFVRPGTRPSARAVGSFDGCPTSCGLCPEHQQHTCVPLLEITDRCNLDCPICLTAGRVPRELTPEEVAQVLDRLLGAEGRLNMLTLSGGEPTVHPQLLRILDACRRPQIGLLSLSTNGIALDRDPDLLPALRERDVVVSLQLDGFEEETGRRLRGRPELAALKRRVVERCLAQGVRLSITATLARGVNEHELPRLIELLLEHERVLSLMVQPLAQAGDADPFDALTIADVVRLLAAGSAGVLRESDFTPLPCSHPSCFALTYLLKLPDGEVLPLPRIVEPGPYLDVIRNQALFGTDLESLARIKDALYSLWSSDGIVPQREAVLARVKQILRDLSALGPRPDHRRVVELGTSHVKSIFIHRFMDRASFDLSRAVQCCNHYPQRDGRLVPACVRNNLHHGAA